MLCYAPKKHDRRSLEIIGFVEVHLSARIRLSSHELRDLPERRTILQEAATGHPSFSSQVVHEKTTLITSLDQWNIVHIGQEWYILVTHELSGQIWCGPIRFEMWLPAECG